jgi:carboxypeptidase Q
MNLLRFRQAVPMVTALFLIPASFAQATGGDKVDLDALAQIKTEAFEHSQVMENLFWMSEVYGPRVTNSRNHKLAAEWAMKQMQEWGLKNVHLEKWPFGYGWQIKHFYAAMETPVYAAFTGFPLAWTPLQQGIHRSGSGPLNQFHNLFNPNQRSVAISTPDTSNPRVHIPPLIVGVRTSGT